MKKTFIVLTIFVLVVLVVGALLFCGQVRKSTSVLITTFGKPTRTITEPGFYFHWPWPVQQVFIFDQRVQNFDDEFDEALTADNYNLLIMVYVGWKINDPEAFFPKFVSGSVSEAENKMKGLIRSAKRSVVSRHPLVDFISTDDKQFKFDAIEKEILAMVKEQVNDKNYGIDVQFLGIKKLGVPEQVTQEVFKRMTSERQVLSSKIQFEGEKEASKIRSSAESKSAELIANADAQATRIKGEAQAEAAKSFAVFQQNPELANFLLGLKALELTLRDRSTLIFDQHSQPFNLFQGYSTNLVNPVTK